MNNSYPGAGYAGSKQIETSTSNIEVVPTGFKFHKFAIFNFQACRVKINNSDEIYLAEGQGFSSDFTDAPIFSLIIVDSGINYNWVGAYKNVSISK